MTVTVRKLVTQNFFQSVENRFAHGGNLVRFDAIANMATADVKKVLRQSVKVGAQAGHNAIDHINNGTCVPSKARMILQVCSSSNLSELKSSTCKRVRFVETIGQIL